MRFPPADITLAILMFVVFGLAGCQQAQRSVEPKADQRANEQHSVAAPNEGQQYFYFDFSDDGDKPPKGFEKFAESITNKTGGSNTADSSIQGDSSQEAGQEGDASGRTDQGQEGEADVEIPLSP